MEMDMRKSSLILFLSAFLLVSGTGPALCAGYQSLEGLQSVKAVFDVRGANPKILAVQMDLIQQTFKDENIKDVSPLPEFAVIFAGQAVKLVSTNTDGFSDKEKVQINRIHQTISTMAKEGIRLEVCLSAANVMGVSPSTILPEIKPVDNGWISLIGYQAKGYSLVPIY